MAAGFDFYDGWGLRLTSKDSRATGALTKASRGEEYPHRRIKSISTGRVCDSMGEFIMYLSLLPTTYREIEKEERRTSKNTKQLLKSACDPIAVAWYLIKEMPHRHLSPEISHFVAAGIPVRML